LNHNTPILVALLYIYYQRIFNVTSERSATRYGKKNSAVEKESKKKSLIWYKRFHGGQLSITFIQESKSKTSVSFQL